MKLESIFQYKNLWSLVKASGVISDICQAALLLLFTCTILKILYDTFFKRVQFSAKIYLSLFAYVAVCAVLFGSALTYTTIGDRIIDLFGVFERLTTDYIDSAKDQLHYLLLVAKEHEVENVSFFNPMVWITNPSLVVISLSINVSILVMIASLSIAPVYLICAILAGPLVFAFAAALGGGLIKKWAFMIIASILIQLSIGIAYMVIGDSMLFTLTGDTFDAGMLQIAGIVALLCIILCLGVPILHGYIFDTRIFYILPLVFGIITFFFGGFVIIAKIIVLMRKSKQLKKLSKGIA